VQDLQQQNARLLVVNRQLSQEAEATRAEAEAALRAENEAALRQLGQEIEELRQGRLATEQVLQQVRTASWVGVGWRLELLARAGCLPDWGRSSPAEGR